MKIVVATDLSEAGILAVEGLCACEAGLFEQVVLLHVVDLDLYTAGGSIPGIMEWARGRLDEEESRLRAAGFEVESRIEQGPALDTIQAVASEAGADLVMVTNLGKGAATGRLFGSTAEQLAVRGSVPVLVDRVAFQDQTWCRVGEGSPFARVLVGIDPDDTLPGMLRAVGSLPGVEAVRVVHVVREIDDVAAEVVRLEQAVSEAGIDITAEVAALVGDPAARLLDEARDWNASVMAVSPCRHGLAHRALFGSVARGIALGADRPVLFVPAA
jgi:nucleotide-binding universal stress UspA family protein